VLAPDAVAALDETEDAQGVDVKAQGDAIGLHESLGGLDMAPSGLLGEEVGEEELAAEVVDGGDEGPFLLGVRGPEMEGSIVLDQCANGGGQDLPVMDLLLGSGPVAIQRLGARRDRRRRDMDSCLPETVAQGAIVVAGDGQPGIFDQLLLPQQLCLDCRLGGGRESGRG